MDRAALSTDDRTLQTNRVTSWCIMPVFIAHLLVCCVCNYVCIIDTLEEIASTEKGEQGTKTNGLAAALQSFAFFFSLRSAVIVFSRTETLSKALQSKKMTVAASSKAIEQTRTILQKFRQESEWNDLWSSCTQDAQRLNLDQPAVLRKRRPPRRIDDGSQPVQLKHP